MTIEVEESRIEWYSLVYAHAQGGIFQTTRDSAEDGGSSYCLAATLLAIAARRLSQHKLQ